MNKNKKFFLIFSLIILTVTISTFFLALHFQLKGFDAFSFLEKTGSFVGSIGTITIVLIALYKIPIELENLKIVEHAKSLNEYNLKKLENFSNYTSITISKLFEARDFYKRGANFYSGSFSYSEENYFYEQCKFLSNYQLPRLKLSLQNFHHANSTLKDITKMSVQFSLNIDQDLFLCIDQLENLILCYDRLRFQVSNIKFDNRNISIEVLDDNNEFLFEDQKHLSGDDRQKKLIKYIQGIHMMIIKLPFRDDNNLDERIDVLIQKLIKNKKMLEHKLIKANEESSPIETNQSA